MQERHGTDRYMKKPEYFLCIEIRHSHIKNGEDNRSSPNEFYEQTF